MVKSKSKKKSPSPVSAPGLTYGAERGAKESTSAWFRRMARTYGKHPRLLASSPLCLAQARVCPDELTPPFLSQLSKDCYEEALAWAESYNASAKPRRQGEPVLVGVDKQAWFFSPEEEAARQEIERARIQQEQGLVVQETTTTKITEGKNGGRRYDLFGHPVTAVLRWMGSQDWTADEAYAVVTAFGIECSESTAKIQVRAGAKKDTSRGEPAKLTAAQVKELEDRRE